MKNKDMLDLIYQLNIDFISFLSELTTPRFFGISPVGAGEPLTGTNHGIFRSSIEGTSPCQVMAGLGPVLRTASSNMKSRVS